MTHKLLIHDDRGIRRHSIAAQANRPIGWATVKDSSPDSNEAQTLAGILGLLGAERLSRRYAVTVPTVEAEETIDGLGVIMSKGRFYDPCLPCLDDDVHTILLATGAQLRALGRAFEIRHASMPNNSSVWTVNPLAPSGLDRDRTLGYQGARYRDSISPATNDSHLLHAYPSAEFDGILSPSHSNYCVLHPSLRSTLDGKFLLIQNFMLAQEFVGYEAVIAVRPLFDGRVPHDRVVLDQTIHAAIGLPQGEPVHVSRAYGNTRNLRRVLFGSRQGVVRVAPTAMVDMEKPVTRLPEEVLDLLGISSGSRVVVQAVDLANGIPKVTHVVLRGLVMRTQSPLHVARSKTGVPDYQQLAGDEDFPAISIDLATRERLGVSPGAAVYLRPALSNLIGREFSTVSLLLLAAIFSATVLASPGWAVLLGGVYVLLTLILLAARLR